MTGPIDNLYERSVDWARRGESHKALSVLLKLFQLDTAHVEALEAAARLMMLLRDTEGAECMQALAKDPNDARRLYEAGYHWINMGRPEVGRSFLEACLKRVGSNPMVTYELAYCNYLDRKFERAVHLLEKAVPDLGHEHVVNAELLRIECLLYAGRGEEGEALLEKTDDEFRAWDRGESADALRLLYARHKKSRAPLPWDLRAWHFVQHGGVLLAQSDRSSGGRFDSLAMNALAVGGILRLLQAVVEGLRLPVDAFLHMGGESLALALALGSLLNHPVRHWEERAGSREMLVTPDLAFLERKSMAPVDRSDCAYLFCFRVFPLKNHVFVPEIIGVMANRFRFPWQERVEMIKKSDDETELRDIPIDDRDLESIATELADAARLLPDDKKAPELVKFYRRHSDLLLLNHPDRFPRRRHFSTLSPA